MKNMKNIKINDTICPEDKIDTNKTTQRFLRSIETCLKSFSIVRFVFKVYRLGFKNDKNKDKNDNYGKRK